MGEATAGEGAPKVGDDYLRFSDAFMLQFARLIERRATGPAEAADLHDRLTRYLGKTPKDAQRRTKDKWQTCGPDRRATCPTCSVTPGHGPYLMARIPRAGGKGWDWQIVPETPLERAHRRARALSEWRSKLSRDSLAALEQAQAALLADEPAPLTDAERAAAMDEILGAIH